MMHLIFYVPVTHAEEVKEAVFEAGAGRIGDYDQCSWEVRGQGQFRPLKGATPYIGQINALEKVEELKVEMVCPDHLLASVIQALKASHPYECPAYFAFHAMDFAP
jgi:hypothetical protein